MQFSLYEPRRPVILKPDELKRKKKQRLLIEIALLVGAVIFVGWMLWRVWPTVPKLTIITGVEAELIIDDVSYGKGTEFYFPSLSVGSHKVLATPTKPIPFFVEQEDRIDLQYGVHERIRMLEVAEIEFISTPEGATIQASNQEAEVILGKTPIKTIVPYGNYEMTLRIPGFPMSKQVFVINETSTKTLGVDFDALALEKSEGKKLAENFIITSLPNNATITVDGKKLSSPSRNLLETGYHKLCLTYNSKQIICCDIIVTNVGKPVVMSWPSGIETPCLYFGKNAYMLPPKVRNFTVSKDGTKLLFNAGSAEVRAVDLSSGDELWVSKIDRSYDGRPSILVSTDNNLAYGIAGIPPNQDSIAFSLKLDDGTENYITENTGGTPLSLVEPDLVRNDTKYIGKVWVGPIRPNNLSDIGIEVVVVRDKQVSRFTHEVGFMNEAQYLGISETASPSTPIFVFQLTNWKGFVDILLCDPTFKESQSNNENKKQPESSPPINSSKPKEDNPAQGESEHPAWKTVKAPFPANGLIADGNMNVNRKFFIWSDNQIACLSYPQGDLLWRYYTKRIPVVAPKIMEAKGRMVIVSNYYSPPYEVHVDPSTGREVYSRKQPISPDEAMGGKPVQGSLYIRGNTVASTVKRNTQGEYKATWMWTYQGIVRSSVWGPVVCKNGTIFVIGSHKLKPFLTVQLEGLGNPKSLNVVGNSEYLVIHADDKSWILDRYGMIKGYFLGVEKIEVFGPQERNVLLMEIQGRKVVVPWP
jgi:hypothetical protein